VEACDDLRVIEDFEGCYRAVQSRDARFDGWFFTAVTSTGIYCRPSCPALTPKRTNVIFFPTAAAAQVAGFRACKRCRPDATPGSPEWDTRADLVGRAMRLIADGVVDRDGVEGLALRLNYSSRHVQRQLTAELGAGPLALARAQRAQTARILIEQTGLPFAQVAFAAGFDSIRQFNDTVREVFAGPPTDLRRKSQRSGEPTPGVIPLRLAHRSPLDGAALFEFLGRRAVAGLEAGTQDTYRRTLRLPHGTATVGLATSPGGYISCQLRLDDNRDLTSAVERCRRLLDLDADPVAVDALLTTDPLLAPLVAVAPGKRVPRTVDGSELVIRAIIGQQVSVAGARTVTARLVARYGKPLTTPDGTLTHLFPEPGALADAAPVDLGMPAARARTLIAVARAMAEGGLCLDPGADRVAAIDALRALPGIGDWTAGYVAMRALGDPDAFLAGDLGVRRAFERLGASGNPASAARLAQRWRPWRAYGQQHLWATL
jgi:AraC family transcriptional regulator of adaptative response / DNA-3-methyladenine glycosylase II